jgi:penicillin-binding protein 2
MRGVVKEGTGRYYAQVPGVEVSGKTGTAENPHGDDHSLFIAFAPSDDPEIAVAAIIENSGYGSVWAAPTNTLMIEQYLTDTIKRKWIEKKILKANFIQKADTAKQETTTPEAEEPPSSITPEDTLDYSDVQNDDTTTNTR